MARSAGPERLTKRELEVLLLLARGHSNQQIAAELRVAIRTVKFHTGNIYAKLALTSRSQAIVWAWSRGAVAASIET